MSQSKVQNTSNIHGATNTCNF